MPNTIVLKDVQVTNKVEKMSKKDKPYHILDSDKGSIMSFMVRNSQGISATPNTLYDMEVEPPGDGFKTYTLVKVLGSRPAPAGTPAAPVQTPAVAPSPLEKPAPTKSYSYGARDASTDLRISKLSVLSTVAAILAEKLKVDAQYATQTLTTLCAEAVAASEFVLRQYVYPVETSAPAAAPVPQTYTPQPVQNTVYTQPPLTSGPAFPPPTPRPETPVNPATTPQAQSLFGVGTLEAEMAARVSKLLGTK